MARHTDALSCYFAIEVSISRGIHIHGVEVDGGALRSAGIDQDSAVTIKAPVHPLVLKHITDRYTYRGIVLRMIDIVSVLLLTNIGQRRKVPFSHQIGRDGPF